MGSEPDLSETSNSHSHKIKSPNKSGGSIVSLGSVTSSATYYTAKDDLSSQSTSLYFTPGDSGSGGDINSMNSFKSLDSSSLNSHSGVMANSKTDDQDQIQVDADVKRSTEAGTGSRASSDPNSTTIEEGESFSSDDLGELKSSMTSADEQENVIEVRDDISRICNTIAKSDEDQGKKTEIDEALRCDNLKLLRNLAVSEGGLLSNALRTRAWPLLLKVSPIDIARNEGRRVPNYFPEVPEKICNLVHLDVARVLKRFPPGLTDPQQDHLQLYLTNLICSVLQENRSAYYYQGFHDISLTFLLVSISQSVPYLAYLCLNKMIESNLNPYMEKTMDRTHDVIHVLFSLIEAEDPALYKKIVVDCKCPVAFCLPWVLTWFSHTLPNDTDVFRLYDFILGSQEKLSHDFLIPIFISASLMLRNAKRLKDDENLTDIASMHHQLSKLPSETESQEPWLQESSKLMEKYAGKEEKLMQRGIEIKAFQNKLWNEEGGSRRPSAAAPRRGGVVVSVGRFLFVRHRWTTMSIVILGAAFFLQTKYGRSVYQLNALKTLKSVVKSYSPDSMQYVLRNWLAISDDGSGNDE